MATKELSAAIIIQARMSSTRLPGKAMLQLAGRRMLVHVVSRFQDAPVSGPLIVATSVEPSDDFIWSWSQGAGVQCYRGSERDVLRRFQGAAKDLNVKYIIRATADNPLIWEGTIAHLGRHITEQGCDYVSYTAHMPLGLGVEIFTKEALERADCEAKEPHQREHVTSYIYENRGIFDCLWISPPAELEGDFRLTVDTKKDYELMKRIYKRLYTPGKIIAAADAIALLRKEPNLAAINADVRQKGSKESQE
ncbi:MAG TPA: glycosyltransferase family protein [Acidobacteriota bacterium]|nr:glycosyltransferase family protein [Acidobacteriota bacterium]